jgi:hypothetical protein
MTCDTYSQFNHYLLVIAQSRFAKRPIYCRIYTSPIIFLHCIFAMLNSVIKKQTLSPSHNNIMATKNKAQSVVNPKIKFSTVLLQAGKTATGIKIPEDIITKLGAGKKPPVKVTINGFTYRSTVAVMGGTFMVGVSAENRKGANVNGGDKIDITLQLDTEERTVEVPAEFQKVLDKNTTARKKFEALSTARNS